MDESFTINEFCAAEKISRSFFYKLDSQGKAPRTFDVGNTRRISRDAYVAWRAEREAAAPLTDARRATALKAVETRRAKAATFQAA